MAADEPVQPTTSWRCRCCGLFRVDAVMLDRAEGPVPFLRVTHAGVLLGYCRNITEVARYVDLAQLTRG